MQIMLTWLGVALLAVGIWCLVLAARSNRAPADRRRLQVIAVVVDLAAAVLIVAGALV